MPIIINLPDGSKHNLTRLLGVGKQNAKLRKDQSYLTAYLAITPHKVKGLGNVCPHATAACAANCLHESGMTMGKWKTRDNIFKGRLARRILYFKHRDVFMKMYHKEMRHLEKKAAKLGLKLAVRLNLLSDVDWVKKHAEMITQYPNVQFYDYTKDVARMEKFVNGDYPNNYHLTFSRSETNEADCLNFLRRRANVAVVFNVKYSNSGITHPLPKTWHRFKVIDGDKSDLRFLDAVSVKHKNGVAVGLRAKGKLRRKENHDNGFVVKVH